MRVTKCDLQQLTTQQMAPYRIFDVRQCERATENGTGDDTAHHLCAGPVESVVHCLNSCPSQHAQPFLARCPHRSESQLCDDALRLERRVLPLHRYNSSIGVGECPRLAGSFDSKQGGIDRLIPRWIFLRALGLIYFSAVSSLAFPDQGARGFQWHPSSRHLSRGPSRVRGKPRSLRLPRRLLWLSSGPRTLIGLCIFGMVASLLLAFNIWPRGMLVICFLCFLSFIEQRTGFLEL